MIIIKSPYKKNNIIYCDFFENGIKKTFFAKIISNYNIKYEISDPFVFTLLFYAVLKKHDIKIEGMITETFKNSLNDIVIFLSNYLKKPIINIETSKILQIKKNENKLGVCINDFSVDSFILLEKIRTNYLIFVDSDCSKENYVNKIKKFSDHFNYKNFIIETNFSRILFLDKKYESTLNIIGYFASMLFIKDYITKFYFNSHVKREVLDLLNCLKIVKFFNFDTAKLDRVEKIKQVSNDKKSYSYLNECKNNINNLCGKCESCKKLLLELDFYGQINNYYGIYDIKKYKNKKNDYLGFLILKRNKYKYLYEFYQKNYKKSLLPYLNYAKSRMTDKELKIGLIYLDVLNFGDMVIYDNTKYLLEKVLKDKKIDNYKIVSIDIGDYNCRNYIIKDETIIKNNEKFSNEPNFIKDWKNSKNYNYYLETEKNKFKNLDLIIFVGGGLIKYSNQLYITMMIDDITKYAAENKIPVIFNGVGIEGYKDDDEICQFLKNAINRKSVIAITTRDDIDILQKKYIINKKIFTALTYDSAIFSSETYKLNKNITNNLVGLGVIRSNIFEEYGHKISEKDLLDFYKHTIIRLKQEKINFKLFTNGGVSDFKFIIKLKEYMNESDDFYELVEPSPCCSYDLVKMISKFKVVVSCRLHGSIIAYSLGIPTIGLVWNNKQLLFGKIINQESNFLTIDNFNSDILVNKIKECMIVSELNIENKKQMAYSVFKKCIEKGLK